MSFIRWKLNCCQFEQFLLVRAQPNSRETDKSFRRELRPLILATMFKLIRDLPRPRAYTLIASISVVVTFVIVAFALIQLNAMNARHSSELRNVEPVWVTNDTLERECGHLFGSQLLTCASRLLEEDVSARRAQFDLRSQQDMSKWAFLAFASSLGALVISGASLLALVGTFSESHELNRKALELNQKQTRAYLEVIRGRIQIIDDNTIEYSLVLVNNGLTEAKSISSAIRFFVHTNNPVGFEGECKHPPIFDAIEPKASIEKTWSFTFDQTISGLLPEVPPADRSWYDEVEDEGTVFIIEGSIEFEDAFSDVHSCRVWQGAQYQSEFNNLDGTRRIKV